METSIFVVVYPEALGKQPIQEHWLCRRRSRVFASARVSSLGGDNEIRNHFGNR